MSNLHLFYADFIKKNGKLTNKQEELLQEAFFPGWADLSPNERIMDSIKDFQAAYNRWEQEQVAIEKKREADKPLPPMDDSELSDLADMF